MRIIKNLVVPTGNIFVGNGDHGDLEFLSIGDYGKNVNLKCDAMGLDREIERVHHQEMLPLEEKWVVTISTQYGCSMGCNFCDVPKVGRGKNATLNDMLGQVTAAVDMRPEVTYSDRLNIHFARMGEPTWNPQVPFAAEYMYMRWNGLYNIHPVVSTMMPRHNQWLKNFIHQWMSLKNGMFAGNAGLQLSVNSTSENERKDMFNGNACSLPEISRIMQDVFPLGRKITLNFAVADYEIDPELLLWYFNPDYYIVKLTPMHKTHTALKNSVQTDGDYTTHHPYDAIEEGLKKSGYDVLVFIASDAEDMSRITCGNAILSGSRPNTEWHYGRNDCG